MVRSGSTFRVKGRGNVVYRVLKPTKRQQDIRLIPVSSDDSIVSCSYNDLIEVENVIRDASGNVLDRSKAWTKIKMFSSEYDAETVVIETSSDGFATVEIRFAKGYKFESTKVKYKSLLHMLANWRQLYGRTLYVDNTDCGPIGTRNPILKGEAR
jgi:hypothetical protein